MRMQCVQGFTYLRKNDGKKLRKNAMRSSGTMLFSFLFTLTKKYNDLHCNIFGEMNNE